MSDEGQTRWRMTLDELSHYSRTSAVELERWRALGAFGDRWRENRDRGAWRHITKLVAHRAIIMRTLLDAGVTEKAAVQIARTHEVKDRDEPLEVIAKNARISIWRSNLNLP